MIRPVYRRVVSAHAAAIVVDRGLAARTNPLDLGRRPYLSAPAIVLDCGHRRAPNGARIGAWIRCVECEAHRRNVQQAKQRRRALRRALDRCTRRDLH